MGNTADSMGGAHIHMGLAIQVERYQEKVGGEGLVTATEQELSLLTDIIQAGLVVRLPTLDVDSTGMTVPIKIGESAYLATVYFPLYAQFTHSPDSFSINAVLEPDESRERHINLWGGRLREPVKSHHELRRRFSGVDDLLPPVDSIPDEHLTHQ